MTKRKQQTFQPRRFSDSDFFAVVSFFVIMSAGSVSALVAAIKPRLAAFGISPNNTTGGAVDALGTIVRLVEAQSGAQGSVKRAAVIELVKYLATSGGPSSAWRALEDHAGVLADVIVSGANGDLDVNKALGIAARVVPDGSAASVYVEATTELTMLFQARFASRDLGSWSVSELIMMAPQIMEVVERIYSRHVTPAIRKSLDAKAVGLGSKLDLATTVLQHVAKSRGFDGAPEWKTFMSIWPHLTRGITLATKYGFDLDKSMAAISAVTKTACAWCCAKRW